MSADDLSAWVRSRIVLLRHDSAAELRSYLDALADAHEAILELHQPVSPHSTQLICETCGSGEPDEYSRPWPCATLKHLAAAYQHDPGYREEWRP